MIKISLFHYCKEVFLVIIIWIIVKNSSRYHYLKKKDFYSHLNMADITDSDYAYAKEVCKEIKQFF